MFIRHSLARCKTIISKQYVFSTRNNLRLSPSAIQSSFSVSFSSSAPTGDKKPGNKSNFNNYVIAGISVAAGIGTYFYLTRNKKPLVEVSDDKPETEIPFVDENLVENLDFLEKQGQLPYLIIGAGTAAFAAFRSIRAKDETSRIVVIGNEPYYPYMRPPLSKEMWFENNPNIIDQFQFRQWNNRERSIFLEKDDFYTKKAKDLFESKNGGITVLRGVNVTRIDPTNQNVFLENGRSLSYAKCLIATGGKPKNLDVFESADPEVQKHVTLFRNASDFRKLHKVLKKVKSITIVGGGFLGSELACAFGHQSKKSGIEVNQIFPEDGNMGKVLPDYLSEWTTNNVRKEGVNVIPKTTIKSVVSSNNRIELTLNNGEKLTTDHVVVAVGLLPSTNLASVSNLEIDEKRGGFLVNAELEARKNLWVAGDAACFYDVKLGRRRVEHHDHAVVSGRLAGENMTGSGRPYWHQSMFWSDLGPEIGYEAIGIVDSSLETIGVFAKATEKDTPKAAVEATDEGIRSETEPKEESNDEVPFENPVPRLPQPGDNFGKGVIFYLRENTIVGIVLWNTFTKIPLARKIINEAEPNQDLTEIAKLFNLKEDNVEIS